MKTFTLIVTLAMPLLAGVRVKSTLTAGGLSTESIVYTQGSRQRLEYGKDATLIQQCDRKRMLQLDDANKTYLAIEAPPAGETKKGGVIAVTTTITDTGETKPAFGFTARHIKTVIAKSPSAEACDRSAEKVETDGWYIDLEGATVSCPVEGGGGGCQDSIKAEVSGNGKLGFPISYVMTTTQPGGKAEVVTMQVHELEQKELPEVLFDVPTNYADARAKKQGAVRVAVGPVIDKTGVAGGTYTQQVFTGLSQAKIEMIEVNPGALTDQQASAKKADADFLLLAEVAEVKRPEPKPASGKRIGGLMARASGLLNTKESWDARVDYKLLPVSGGEPLLTSSSTGKVGGSSLNVMGAVSLAATAGSIMMMGPMGAQMMMNGNLGMMVAQMGGGKLGGGMMGGGMGMMGGSMAGAMMGGGQTGAHGMDPSLMGLQMLASSQRSTTTSVGGGMPGASGNSEAAKAVNAAIAEMVKAVLAQVKK